MRIDLRNQLAEGMNNLQTWRSRYSKGEYGEKVLLNVFYRKYSTFFMWDKIQNSFNGNVLWNDFNIGFREMMNLYQNQAMQTQPILLQLLSEKSNNPVGSVTYAGFADKIRGAKQGKNEDIEEIEFTYLHYLLNDQLILMWSAFGGTGLSKIDALVQMSGVIIAETDMSEYGKVENIIGQLCTGPYLHENYNPLPPL
ncbi:hypothetical protein [Leeuwenhoekiella blandensis]|uniref:Uncharacterized protein n=1 Tax=Leeuwenhoekiella blandensis (strain CECT 7118 / CCUG 51940 / KCTC 22103 / MED217) TaxID=398720 RepID=A3XLG3_LEEBM|nr:hypothetical protein [Leeuwenhoekiella blandensis]EAQ49605.1 hypothetical protein MED217_12139 [Leeuwenhoekiella blandensis MED217]